MNGLDRAKELDMKFPSFRDHFHIPHHDGKEVIYLCGNSLGLQPKSVRSDVEKELLSWEKNGVEGHFKDTRWVSFHEEISEMMRNVVGGERGEVVVMNTLTVNLHLMMVSFYRPTKARYKILIEGSAFPSDQYAVKSQLKFHGIDPEDGLIELRHDKGYVSDEHITQMIEDHGDSIALILLGGVNYYTGQVFDMEKITKIGHSKGCVVGYDLAHAVGNVELELHNWGVDFAVWCTYKYLNSGPGAIAGCFVHERHAGANLPRFAGWWGHDKQTRFLMGDEFVPIKGAEGWQLSNAPILSMVPIKSSLRLFNKVGMKTLRRKSIALTNYLVELIDSLNTETIWISPPDGMRGCQISIHVIKGGKGLYEYLTQNGVICDWREPDVIRIAPVPLYNTFEDVWKFVKILKEALLREIDV